MNDAEDLTVQGSGKIDPADFGARFSRTPGSADLDTGDRERGAKKTMEEATLTGLRAMLKNVAPAVTEASPARDFPVVRQKVPMRKPLKESKSGSLCEVGGTMQNSIFGFAVSVQELTEDGGFIGRGAGVGRIRVRGNEMGNYQRVE